MKQSKVIGLTGGSGSGKSTVASALEKNGAFIIDCDKIAHQNMAKGGIAYDDIVACFGSGILAPDGEIDRKKLGAIVFEDKNKLEGLNKITHGYIAQRVRELVLRSAADITVIDAPLLHKAGLDSLCDEVWLTDAPRSVRLERIMQRDLITREQAESRLKNQDEYDSFDKLIITDFETLTELEQYIKELI